MRLKYIFLILSIVVILIVFYRKYNSGLQFKEGNEEMTLSSQSCDQQRDCSGDYSKRDNLPLREYCVKSSFNSAYDGTDVSKETILQRIKDGYRFIDLNVYSDVSSGDVHVGYSPDNAPEIMSNKLLLADALKCINDSAFSSATVFDPSLSNVASYPIFVHIRVYRRPGSNVDIIAKVAKIITGSVDKNSNAPSYSSNYLRDSDGRPEQINGCTNLSTIMGKILFSMDILNILQIYAPINYQDASTIPTDTIDALQTFVNILTGGSTLQAFYRYTDESLISRTNKLGIGNSTMNGSYKTNVQNMYISFPHPDDALKTSVPNNPKLTGVVQPDITTFILDRSVQFMPLRDYLADPNLTKYKKLFDDIGTPFAPMVYVYQKLHE
jgi:hypothetical protein